MKTLRFVPRLLLLLLLFPALLPAQTPLGGAIRVATAGGLQGPSVAMSPRGDFVVAWSELRSGNRQTAVFCRLYAADGSPSTAPVLIHRGTTAARTVGVRLAMMTDGSFVAVFPTPAALLAQRFTARGKPMGGNLVVTPESVASFEIGSRGDGSFAVTWVGDLPGIATRAFGPAGQPLGPQVAVVDASTGAPRLAVGADGSFLVVWVQVETS
ncbi:MAG TPA: hypothetical protein VF173_06525 [Thermoanaerobaculia bacterium]|nr:hypothetical protein [Thermoanaerobaculia bacterium]